MVDEVAALLERKLDEHNRPSFISRDPVSIPHAFQKKQDIEIAGFFAAIFAWGNRVTIIRKSGELMERMGRAPHSFCLHHRPAELEQLKGFCHRTFNDTDLLYFLEFLSWHYRSHDSLEEAFTRRLEPGDHSVESALNGFQDYFFSLPSAPARTRKHIPAPSSGSSCKRLCMFLRWMVRKDERGVDFGLWHKISPAQLVCPLDVHVARVARKLGLLQRKQDDWQAALELTTRLRQLDPQDPIRYDLALFGLGVNEKSNDG